MLRRVHALSLLGCLLVTSCFFAGYETPNDFDQAGGRTDSGACEPLQTLFDKRMWQPLMSQVCVQCHVQGGAAGTTALVLDKTDVGKSFGVVRAVAKMAGANGTSLLLLKPTGQVMHGGGTLLDKSSDTYKAFAEFVKRSMTEDGSCK